MEESHIMHGDALWHPGMSLGASAVGWRSQFPFGFCPFHEGTAGPGWKWPLLSLLSPLVQHKAVPVWGQTHALGAGGTTGQHDPAGQRKRGLGGNF